MRSIAQEYIDKGIEQGLQKGVKQGLLFTAKNMLLQLHLGINAVQQATGLSREELIELQKEG